MRQKIAAFLLSALVFPGLGQLYNQDRRKGIILVLAANGLLGLVFLTRPDHGFPGIHPGVLPPPPHR